MKVRCKFDKMVSLDKLKPHPDNHNDHSPEQIERLAKILKYQGWRYPIKVSKQTGYITSGHGRLLAAKQLKLKSVPVNYQKYDSHQMEIADLIADNAIASWAELDLSAINNDLKDYDPDFDIELLGIEDFEIEPADKYEGKNDDIIPDKVKAKVKLDEIWQLGEHRLMCGDATKDINILLEGKKVDTVFTSPPYNGNTHLDYGKGQNKKLYEGFQDNLTSDEYYSFCSSVLNEIIINCNGFIFWNVNYNAKSKGDYLRIISNYWDKLWETVVWKKKGMPISHGLTRDFEFIFILNTNKSKIHLGEEFKTESNVWDISNHGANDKDNHRACFPVGLPEKAIELSKSKLVLDPFGGSGTTLIACEKTNRKCYMMEIDPKYCDVIIKRWEDYTGKKAVKLDTQKKTVKKKSKKTKKKR